VSICIAGNVCIAVIKIIN